MFYLTEFACVVAEVWMIHTFLSCFFSRKKSSIGIMMLAYAVFAIVLTALSLLDEIIYIRVGFTVLAITMLSVSLFQSHILSGLLSGVAFCAISAIIDFIAALLFQICGFQATVLLQSSTTRSLYLVICHILMLAFVLLTCLISKKTQKQVTISTLLPVAPCWAVSLVLCFLLSWQYLVKGYVLHPLFIVVLLGLLYTSILVIYYINSLQRQAQEKRAWEIAEHHYAMQQEYYDQLRVQQEETRALWHDISKYLRAAQVDSSNKALQQVQEMLDGIDCVVDVSNRIVSVILNEYVQATKATQIALDLDVQVPEVLFVTAADLYVLIGNTMDNSIEACQDLPPEQRKISLKLKMHNNILFYEISNPYQEAHLHRIRNHYHGYGLKNVERCVEKYNGTVETSKCSGIFTVSAHLNSI